ncbi:hypothetical protein B0T26DRAFT_749364 [Lasiosphaeria miniovina]|uniref:Uncharacterized protein n=1 Tax=Lasiosphaeria miniovina TaxID=1954250 RepID=A0AA40E2L2_9PEZI|nr:uncharacterized protein B0T26DRAFT_749364 [Lasiosphaeria miniovina]KAK0721896.1 hypothetical protein B0T26DRAFT_749364 [Lasiosphaeria miniovina]
MSNFTTPPDPVGLAYSGTFVNADGDNSQGALFCMNARLFWDSWLLPLLQELNQGTQLVPLKPYLVLPGDDQWDFRNKPELEFGSNPDHEAYSDQYFSFTKSSSGGAWTWNGGELTSENTLNNHGHNIKVTETGTSSTTLSFDSGGQKILITGKSNFGFELKYQNEDIWAYFNTETNWHLNFALQAVSEGGLQITRLEDPPGTEACTTSYNDGSNNLGWEIPFDGFCKSLSDWFKSYFTTSLGWLTNTLVTALQDQHQLFLPGSGVFLMNDPRFNLRGDLLVTLQYNG